MKNNTAPTIAEESEPLEGLPAVIDAGPDMVEAWRKIPTRAAQILTLLKIGYTLSDVSSGFGVCRQTVKDIRDKYDPSGCLRLPPSVGKQLAAARFERLALVAMDNITPDKLASASAPALATVAGIASDKAERIRASMAADKARDDVAGILSAMRAHVSPALPDPDTTTD